MKRALVRWAPWLKYLIALALLVFVFASGHINYQALAGTLDRWPWLVGGVLAVAGIFGFGILRWWLLLLSQGIRITLWEAVRVAFIGYFFNIFMPGSVGGDLVKAYYVARDREGQRVEAISTIALDRLIGLYALISIGAVAAIAFPSVGFGPEFRLLSWFLLAAVAGGGIVGALFLLVDLRRFLSFGKEKPGRILSAVGRIYDAFWLYRKKKRVIALALLLSFGTHSVGILQNVMLARALGESEMTASQYMYVIPLGLVVNGIPLAPGGWGQGELGYAHLFEMATGKEDNIGASLALLMHIALTLWNLAGVVFYLGHKREVQQARFLAEKEAGP
ncbi:MAG: lysylphosphatidylglycerol synthase transmembrane domain-containing protein [Planctomycetota bacterium]|nr:lysylphosphatidylglycerol synthase transmembrane domain-containing protein [Planctomycetota bacterium]